MAAGLGVRAADDVFGEFRGGGGGGRHHRVSARAATRAAIVRRTHGPRWRLRSSRCSSSSSPCSSNPLTCRLPRSSAYRPSLPFPTSSPACRPASPAFGACPPDPRRRTSPSAAAARPAALAFLALLSSDAQFAFSFVWRTVPSPVAVLMFGAGGCSVPAPWHSSEAAHGFGESSNRNPPPSRAS